MVVAECALAPKQVLAALNRGAKDKWQWAAPLADDAQKVLIFTRFESRQLAPRLDAPRWTLREWLRPDAPALTLAAVHFPSKWNTNADSQAFECIELANDIATVETQVGHRRTLVVGDFNMNPFEEGMIAANGLHAQASRRLASGGSRRVDGRDYRFFYNPMWNFWGDNGRGPGGTYFYRGSQIVTLNWNIFDQVLLRPELLPFFEGAQLEILTTDGETSFLTRAGTPTTRGGSDHLPISFRLNF